MSTAVDFCAELCYYINNVILKGTAGRMNTIFDVYKALSKNKNSAQVGLVYDPATDSLSFKKDGRIFTACIDGGRLSVCIIDGREHYIYFERLRELFCLLNGIVKGGLDISKNSETALKINGRPLKEFRKPNIALGIFSILIAIALMLFSVCLMIGYVFSDFSDIYYTLTNLAMLPFCIGVFICGIRLAVYAVKQRGYKKVIGLELFGTAVGWFSLTLLAINWAEYYKRTESADKRLYRRKRSLSSNDRIRRFHVGISGIYEKTTQFYLHGKKKARFPVKKRTYPHY